MTGKKRIFAGMGILLGVLVGVQGTAAYQSAYDKAVNIVTPGNISSEIGEDFPNPPTIVPDKDIDIAKKIWVSNNPSGQNQTGTDCYVRVGHKQVSGRQRRQYRLLCESGTCIFKQ